MVVDDIDDERTFTQRAIFEVLGERGHGIDVLLTAGLFTLFPRELSDGLADNGVDLLLTEFGLHGANDGDEDAGFDAATIEKGQFSHRSLLKGPEGQCAALPGRTHPVRR